MSLHTKLVARLYKHCSKQKKVYLTSSSSSFGFHFCLEKNKWGGKKHWSNKTAKLTNEIRICHTHNHGSGAGRCVLRKLAHMKISLLFCAKFQGTFFTWIFTVLFPSEKAEIQ